MDNRTQNNIGEIIKKANWQLSSDLENRIMKEVDFISVRRKQIKRDRKATLLFFCFAIVFGLFLNFIPQKFIPDVASLSGDAVRLVFQFALVLLLVLFVDSAFVVKRSHKVSAKP